MAETEMSRNDALNKSVITEESKVKSDIYCVHCDQLKLELQKAKLKIASYEEILKIIQDEIAWKKEVDTSHPSIDSTVISSE
jgi:predicted metal-dependent RNase